MMEKNCQGEKCLDCGEIIHVYSKSGLCRPCFRKSRGTTVEGLACWYCGLSSMKLTGKLGHRYSKCAECSATDNKIKV